MELHVTKYLQNCFTLQHKLFIQHYITMIQVHFPNYATVFPDIKYRTKIKDETHHNIDISYTITDYRLRGRKKYHHHYRMFNSLDPQSLNNLHEYQIFSAFSISPTANCHKCIVEYGASMYCSFINSLDMETETEPLTSS